MGQMMGLSTLVVNGTAGTRESFSNIEEPEHFRLAVYDQIEANRPWPASFQRRYMPLRRSGQAALRDQLAQESLRQDGQAALVPARVPAFAVQPRLSQPAKTCSPVDSL